MIITFLIQPYPSHYYPVFGLAKQYQENGFEIVFTGTEDLRNVVETEGFKFICFQYSTEYNIQTFKGFLGLWLKSRLTNTFLWERYRDFYSVWLAFKTINNQFQPTIIYIDEHLSDYYLFSKALGIETIILNTKLSTQKAQGIPPLNSGYIPTNTWWSNLVCMWLWWQNKIKKHLQEQLLNWAFAGKQESYFQKRFCQKRGWDFQDIFSLHYTFGRGIPSLSTIILAPKALEFSQRINQKNENYFHVPIKRNEEKYKTTEYYALLEEIALKKPRIIYASLGTLSGIQQKKVQNFYEKLINATKNLPNILLVISQRGLFPTLNTHVRFFDYIPQVDFLQYVSVVVSHGGLGSLKECDDANVPVLVYPLNEKIDQTGNAARVVANNLGLRGNLTKDTEIQISKKIQQLLKFD